MQPQLLTVITEEKLKTWSKDEWAKWWIEPKHDGARLIYHKGQFLSRTGKPLHNLEHIAAELAGVTGWTLDGEICGDGWADTMSVARSSKTKKDGNGLKFHVFDALCDLDWKEQTCVNPLDVRRDRVWSLVEGMQHVQPVWRLRGLDYAFFEGIHTRNLAEGCDGTVLKLGSSLYEFKRTKTWLKVKPCLDADGVVVGFKEGTGKYKGMLGALEVLPEGGWGTDPEDHKTVTTFVSGMTDEQRREWWKDPGSMIGKTIEVKIRGVHPSGRWIEPRFHRIREDK